ncbi:MAG: FkbM family methyltransferase [Proteobacteria bacterium]|nr:FkbM family methyltransferase [Pseudomonadota bacterium]
MPKIRPRPGWRFAEEYYDRRLWLACRRGALWEAANTRDPATRLLLTWYDKLVVDVTLGNDNSLCLYVCGSFEPNEFAFLDGFLKPGMVFIDVGANDGYYSLFAARRVGPTGRVAAAEPSTRERVNLKRNLALNGLVNVDVIPAALGASAGEAELHLAHGGHSGHNTLGQFAHEGVVAARSERVFIETLDEVVSRLAIKRVDFIKIDVEGAEASVIAGARNVIESMRPSMLLEINEGALQAQGTSADGLLSMLRNDMGYEILVFSPETGLPEPPSEGSALSANVLAVPKEKVGEILR